MSSHSQLTSNDVALFSCLTHIASINMKRKKDNNLAAGTVASLLVDAILSRHFCPDESFNSAGSDISLSLILFAATSGAVIKGAGA